MYTEKELLDLAAKGDPAAFTMLFNNYKDKLYGFLIRLTGSAEMTEDIVQEAFLKLWKNRESLHEIDHFSGYLFKLTRNHALNAFKRLATETQVISSLRDQTEQVKSDASNPLVFKELKALLHTTLEKLPPQQKLIFQLNREHGLKPAEIANQLHLSTATVKNHLVQALRKVRETFITHANLLAGLWIVAISSQ